MIPGADFDVVMRVNGSWERIEPKGASYKVTEVQRLLSGYFALVPLPGVAGWMLVDDDGMSKQLPPNQEATAFARQHGRRKTITVLGDALVVRKSKLV